jgi:DNA-directed RNA polymerase subunit RPC12/RpoP
LVSSPGYATLRMGLRPPRVAVVFDGGVGWHYWARLALHTCTKLWGGEGFILVPHDGGRVRPEMLAAVRAYDPDYVVTLQRTIRTVEEAAPGSLKLTDPDGQPVEGTRRDQLVEQLGDSPVEFAADAQARDKVASVCSPHRRRAIDGEGWDEDVTILAIDGGAVRLTKAADIPHVAGGTCLSAPPDWGGPLGVAVAARCGAVEEPRVGGDHGLDEKDLRRLVYWLVDSERGLGAPPFDIVWHFGAALNVDPASVGTAFERTTHGLTSIGRGFRPRRRVLLSVGDGADDFALAYLYQRLYGHGIWLPTAWWATNGTPDKLVSFAVRTVVSRHVLHGDSIAVATTSVDSATMDAILADLRQPTAWGEGDEERMAQRYEKHITRDALEWSADGVLYLAVDGQFDQDYAIPITRNDAGDVEMVVPCPPPVVNHPDLAACTTLHWQVDIELIEADTPRGRGLDGHTLLADGQDPYLTWIRSGRDGVVYESERLNFIVAGTSPASRLARPRLRVPSLATWAGLMVAQDGKRMQFSAAGRRVEVMRRLWGDRAALAEQFAGPMLPVLRAFRPSGKKSTFVFDETDGVVLPTGAGDHLWEGYLTFAGILKYGGADDDSVPEFRGQIDESLERGILRRGLILGCAQCGRPAFLAIDELAQVNRCPRCSAHNNLSHPRWKQPKTEPQWYYDLHPTVREHLSQDGEIPLLLSHHLRAKSRSYVDVAELELTNPDTGPLAEADLIALSDGQMITAEAKRPGSLGTARELRRAVAKRALLAEQLRADQILIATAEAEWQQASIDALCHEIRNRPWSITAPRARLVCGLGTNAVTDLRVDAETGQISPWP